MSDRPEVVIKRNTQIKVVATIGSLLALSTVLKVGKGLIRIDGEKFVLIGSDFSRLL